MFHPVPTAATLCGHTVARLSARSWNVDATDDGYATSVSELSELLTGCPVPQDCALDVAWKLDEDAEQFNHEVPC